MIFWKNKYVWVSLTALFILIGALGIGYVYMAGENPVQLGVTLWHLNDSGREGLKIAADDKRHLVKLEEEELASYLPRMDNQYRGEWELIETYETVWTFQDQGSEEARFVEVDVQPFLGDYRIVHILTD